MAVRVVGDVGVEVNDAEAAARNRRSVGRCTQGAEVVAKVFFWTCSFLLSPLRRERSRRRNALAWTRTTRSGDCGLLVDSVACSVAVRVVVGVGVKVGDAEAAARSRRAIERNKQRAEVVAKVVFWTCPFLLSQLRRE